jgi:hypothetical protein
VHCEAPQPILNAWDEFTRSHPDHGEHPLPQLQEIFAHIERQLETLQARSVTHIDQVLLEKALTATESIFSNLLIYGFNCLNWDRMPLLKSAVKVSTNTVLCFEEYRQGLPEMVWNATWEAITSSEITAIESPISAPFAPIAQSWLNREICALDSHQKPIFYIAANPLEEAQLIVHQAKEWLRSKDCTRLGIVLPAQSRLRTEILSLFKASGIFPYDAIGDAPVYTANERLLQQWIEWQQSGTLKTTQRWTQALIASGKRDEHTGEVLLFKLIEAARNCLTTDADYLIGFLQHEGVITDGDRFYTRLPHESQFADFWNQTLWILETLRFTELIEVLREHITALNLTLNKPILRSFYLSWLSERCLPTTRIRPPSHRNSYHPIHLLPINHVGAQTFSHLILCGLQRTLWPIQQSTALLNDNQRHQLNRQFSSQGPQGEGQTVHSGVWLLSKSEHSALSREAFANLITHTSEGLCLTGSVREDPLDEAEIMQLSPYLLQLFQLCENRFPERRDVCQIRADETSEVKAQNPDLSSAFNIQCKPPLRLSVQHWDRLLSDSYRTITDSVMRVKSIQFGALDAQARLTQGIWLHEWIQSPHANRFVSIPSAEEWNAHILEKASQTWTRLQEFCEASNVVLSSEWKSRWAQTLTTAFSFAHEICCVEAYKWMASEYVFSPTCLSFNDTHTLTTHGKADLLLSSEPNGRGQLCIVDFKTGKERLTGIKYIGKQSGNLQLALYLLLARKHFSDTRIQGHLCFPESGLTSPILCDELLESIQNQPGFWNALSTIEATGMIPLNKAYLGHDNQEPPTLSMPLALQSALKSHWAKTCPYVPFSA